MPMKAAWPKEMMPTKAGQQHEADGDERIDAI